MKISLRKTLILLLLATAAFAFSLPLVAQCASIAGEEQYTYSQVFEACEGAYDNGAQVAACVNNVCCFYGCTPG